jgi:beta-glucanase (GH16 family)
MLKHRLISLVCLLGLVPAGCLRLPAPPAARPGWRLVWADEFNRDGLPDPKKWIYEEGFVRNNEAQYYTRARRENARVEHGMLVLEARKERIKNSNTKPDARDGMRRRPYAEYTSAALETRGLGAWKYGRFEIRAKLPRGAGTWPAFWTRGVGRGWPTGGEIDIMEWWGKKPDEVTGCVHYQVGGKHLSSQGRLPAKDPSAAFHVYALEWTPWEPVMPWLPCTPSMPCSPVAPVTPVGPV